jgi:hypothetical protein
MLSLDECIGMCGLSEEEVAVVADHEQLPTLVAAELASSLVDTPRGVHRLHQMFMDALSRQAERPDRDRERALSQVYAGFRARYPMPRVI